MIKSKRIRNAALAIAFATVFSWGLSVREGPRMINATQVVYAADLLSGTASTDSKSLTIKSSVGDTSVIKTENITNAANTLSKNLQSTKIAITVIGFLIGVMFFIKSGFQLIKDGSGDAMKILKEKGDFRNAVTAMIFFMAIPIMVHFADSLYVPTGGTFTLSNNEASYTDSSVSSTATLRNSMIIDSGYIKTYLDDVKNNTATSTATDNSTDILKNMKFGEMPGSGIGKILLDFFIGNFCLLIYYVVRLVTITLGNIAFMPITFDSQVYKDAGSSLVYGGGLSFLTGNSLTTALASFTDVLGQIYYVIKELCYMVLDLCCYYYGIMLAMNKTNEDISMFLKRLAESAIAMAIAPLFIQLLLDLDMILSSAIMSVVGGKSIPGMAILSALPDISFQPDYITVILFLLVAVAIFLLCKSFIIRKIEICLLFIISPVVGLLHLVSFGGNGGAISKWFNELKSAVFMTTLYSPFFLIVIVLIANAKTCATTDTGAYIFYYMLIVVLLFTLNKTMSKIAGMVGLDSSEALKSAGHTMNGLSSADGYKKGLNQVGAAATLGQYKNAGEHLGNVAKAPGKRIRNKAKRIQNEVNYRRKHGGKSEFDELNEGYEDTVAGFNKKDKNFENDIETNKESIKRNAGSLNELNLGFKGDWTDDKGNFNEEAINHLDNLSPQKLANINKSRKQTGQKLVTKDYINSVIEKQKKLNNQIKNIHAQRNDLVTEKAKYVKEYEDKSREVKKKLGHNPDSMLSKISLSRLAVNNSGGLANVLEKTGKLVNGEKSGFSDIFEKKEKMSTPSTGESSGGNKKSGNEDEVNHKQNISSDYESSLTTK